MLMRSDAQAWIDGLKEFLARIALALESVEPMARPSAKAIMVHSA